MYIFTYLLGANSVLRTYIQRFVKCRTSLCSCHLLVDCLGLAASSLRHYADSAP